MKTFFVALLFLCAFMFPEFFFLVPGVQAAIDRAAQWIWQMPPVWIFGAMIVVLLLDTWNLQRTTKWGEK